MKLKDFDFYLPDHLIAKEPLADRSESKLMLLKPNFHTKKFKDLLELVGKDDVIVVNDTKVIKYYQDRTLVFNPTIGDQTDYVGLTNDSKVLSFESSAQQISASSGFKASVDQNFSGISTTSNNKVVSLGVNFEMVLLIQR